MVSGGWSVKNVMAGRVSSEQLNAGFNVTTHHSYSRLLPG